MASTAKKERQDRWPKAPRLRDMIDLHVLPPVAQIDGARMRALTGNDEIPLDASVILRTFLADAGDRQFFVGFCVGDGEAFSATGLAVIERLSLELDGAPLHIVRIQHRDIAWDMVLRHLQTFKGECLLFAFADSHVYDAAVPELHYSKKIRQFSDGVEMRRLSSSDRQKIRKQIAARHGRSPASPLLEASNVAREDVPWIFRFRTPTGKEIRVSAWNGRRDFAHELPVDVFRRVGGDHIVVVQVDSPVAVRGRSSLNLTHTLADTFDAVIHWARDTVTYESIVQSFVRLDLESVEPPERSDDWDPEVTFVGVND